MAESFSGSGYIFPQVKMSCEWSLQSMAPPKTESRLISNPKKQTKQLNQPCNVPQTCKDVQKNLGVIFSCKYQISWNDFLASTVIYFSHNQVQNITCHTLKYTIKEHTRLSKWVCACVCVWVCVLQIVTNGLWARPEQTFYVLCTKFIMNFLEFASGTSC